ncbi:MAG: hypothetical protein ACP5UQ_01325 [Anaerolineae bacterium]
MKIRSHPFMWALSFLLAGAFLLLKNFGVFRDLGDAIWGGVFAAMGAGFLAWYLLDRERVWRAIAGFPLLTVGALLILAWQKINLGDRQAAAVLFGVALGFWAVLLTHDNNWWAILPAGILTVLSALTSVQDRLSASAWLGFFVLGLGIVFGLLYLLRLGQQDAGWAGLPAAAFLLLGLATLAAAFNLPGLVAFWWPAGLVVVGALLLIFALPWPAPAATPASAPSTEAQPTAAAAPAHVNAAPRPAAQAPATEAEAPVDIYALLQQQPQAEEAKEQTS